MPKNTESSVAKDQGETPEWDVDELNLGALSWIGMAWIETMSDLGSEVASFVADRIREDVKTQHEILHCKSVAEMQAIQAAFLERAYVQYTVETGKLIERGTSLFPQLSARTKHTPL